jgi:hypothetical protein
VHGSDLGVGGDRRVEVDRLLRLPAHVATIGFNEAISLLNIRAGVMRGPGSPSPTCPAPYVLCNDRRTLRWLANQRAVEYHPILVRVDRWDHPPTSCSVSIRHPRGGSSGRPGRAPGPPGPRRCGPGGAVKTSGPEGLHVAVPIEAQATIDDAAASTRAIAARPERLDPGLPRPPSSSRTAGQCLPRCDPDRRSDRRGGVQPATTPARWARPAPPAASLRHRCRTQHPAPPGDGTAKACSRGGSGGPWPTQRLGSPMA